MLQLLEAVTHLQPLVIDPGKIEIILQADHILSKLAIALLPLIAQIKLLIQLRLQVLKIQVDL